MNGLVLSIFPGADLLGRGFEDMGFCIVRGPELILGGDIRNFFPPAGAFDGVIGGSPCQDFSRARRTPATGYGLEMLKEFQRVVTEAAPQWCLLENVPGVPDLCLVGYKVQRFNINAKEVGCPQNRLRCFQFGFRTGQPLVIDRGTPMPGASHAALASEGRRGKSRRAFDDFCVLQGLPSDFDLPGLSRRAKYAAVGNGVPIKLARVLAVAIRRRPVTLQRVCICNCGRKVRAGQTLATAGCRKRMQKKRDAAAVTVPGTPAESQLELYG
jgi:DNA (cytosine-5)-methyltransferase 1